MGGRLVWDEIREINRERRDEMRDVKWAEAVVEAGQTCLHFCVSYSTAPDET